MLTIPNYQFLTLIYESANSLIYRGLREKDNQSVILKILKEDYPTPQELLRYRQEYDITRRLENVDGVIRAYSLEKYQNTLVVCLEDFDGKSLTFWLTERRLSQEESLTLAIRLVDILGQIHQQNIIHKDINPANLVWNPSTGVLKIIDFGISTQLSRQHFTIKDHNVLDGTLAYMSPEQTGRMNRALDYRTDFYSLGATFYELLTRQLPFETKDTMKLVHCHIAKQPPRPIEVNPEIPSTVSDIIMKLLEKTAEERYQSAWGIKADLENCLNQWQRHGSIEKFQLAQVDISERFQISQKLYGRECEIETLLTAFERVTAGSSSEMMLVAGYSGLGKSVLVREIYKSLTEKRGYFIAGKFDQFQRNIPYSAVFNAFSELVQQLLTESEAQLTQWKDQLLTALGPNGQIIIDVIPEMELIIGPQPAVPTLGATESQNRFNLFFQNFIRVFCQPAHPLVIFLDDLQWVDSATLKLLEVVMTDRDTNALFLIGAYRDNEVSPTHPFTMTLDTLRSANVTINQITLKPLAAQHINRIIADSLHQNSKAVGSLTDLVMRKTGGNPFFANHFLHTLYEENLLYFVPPTTQEKGRWQWDIAQIEVLDITDNVVELMISKLKKLPLSSQYVLRLAACVGNHFDLDTLSIIYEKSAPDTFQDLMPVLTEEFILPLSELEMSGDDIHSSKLAIREFRFLHDRVQQAAYALIAEEQKQRVHQQIGQLLLQNTALEELEQKIFTIVDQLNVGRELIEQPSELEKLAELNLLAAKKAKASAAYKQAFDYLKIGLGLLGKDSWQTQYDLTLALYVNAVEAAYLSGNFEQMEPLAEIVLQHAKAILDVVTLYDINIQASMAQNQPRAALKHGLTALKLLGVEWNEQPSQADVMGEIQETQRLLEGKPLETLGDLPSMTDATKRATIQILLSIMSPSYQSVPEMFPLAVCKMVQLLIKYGTGPSSAVIYAEYCTVISAVTGDIEQAYQFAQLALNLSEPLNAREFKAKTYIAAFATIVPWKTHVRNTLKPLVEGYQTGLETGDLEFGCYDTFYYCLHSFFVGKELAGLAREMANYSESAEQLKQNNTANFVRIIWQTVLNLMVKSNHSCQLIGEAYNEIILLPQHQQANDKFVLCTLHIHKLYLCYLFQDYTQAVENAKFAELNLGAVLGGLQVAIFHFYDSLARLAVYPDSLSHEQDSILDKVAANQEKMQKWAHHAPMNFLHKFYLVEAERCRVLGKDGEAREFYDKAIEGARENEYLNEEALTYELAGQFYLAKSLPKLAQVYLRDAHYAYQRWGALAKVADLGQRYPQFLAQKTSRVPVQSTIMAMTHGTVMDSIYPTQVTPAISLDLNSVVKASQTLSGEIVLSRLLENMMQIVIENAGAEKGFLLLPQQDKWFIEAEGSVDNPSISVLQSLPVESHPQVAKAITYYVARTQESVVLNNATREGNFTHDPYIVKHQPKSVLCAPLLNQTKLTGILYLENNLTTGAFTPDRLEMLNLLSSQAAISIENSILYNGLEQKVAERTQELKQEIVVRKSAEDAAKVANQAKSAFLANMSHELRTPLNAILGFAQIMQRSHSLGSEHQENVQIINRSGDYLLSLINDVLDMSKIEAGKITLDEQNFDLHRLLDEVHDLFYLRAESKHLELRIERSDEVPRYIRTDGTKLRQVLINLLGNALKFTQQGGVYLSVDEIPPLSKGGMTSKTGVDTEEISLHFRVADTGAGVAPEELDKLFEAFTRTASGIAAQEGTGLGLPISRKFVQLMGGDITVQSQVGNGTVFQFTIHVPVVSAADIAKEQRPQRQVVALEPNQPRYRLLIVDDKWDNRQLLIKLLNPFGFELREASNGQEAVDICDKWQPHLIWMDIRMQGMDGLQATQQIKATPTGKEVAIVALTASTLEEEKTLALSAGCDDFLRKPFREADIFNMMHKLIGVRYVYDELKDPVSKEEVQEVLTPKALTALPDDLLMQMQQAAIDLDTKLMQTLIAQVRQQHESVANGLSQLEKELQYEHLLELIEQA